MPGPEVIGVSGLRKSYGAVPVLHGVDLHVGRGEIFALLGPNGAGKTTTQEILTGFSSRSAGSVSVLGEDPAGAGSRWRARIGIVPQDMGSFDQLTVKEVVSHFASLYPDPLPVGSVIERTGLGGKANERTSRLSGGQRRRLDIALGIVGRPELVFLDEPTTGLDPQARRGTWDLIRALAADGTTVMLTTHYLDEVEVLCDRVAILLRGKVAEQGAPADIGGRAHGEAVIEFQAEGPLRGAELPTVQQVGASLGRAEGQVRIGTAAPAATLRVLLEWSARLGSFDLPGLTVTRPTLEDVYLRMIAADAATPASEPELEHVA
ncbi:ABC-2 type transport system ATP-binding protein [Actinacidiphila yanglinensis]|uniref:ABC-type xenobiotic transporter n=1 Tax=Actinacidiphila yanglinensis TaxID=310779 RepID=A0A1H5YXA9_9ACTN|nr:ABC transporter ATP-binding protein [Actinacidiphila yanglinensis]SEG28067.1 ABC-2 type transport system ATP-binding protein [Actinacidiphila yanglinensis]